MGQILHQKQEALEQQSFKYLDIFEQQMREQKQARKEFYEQQDQEEKELDKNKPAFFRQAKEPHSSDKEFDEATKGLHGRKAEDARAWKNL